MMQATSPLEETGENSKNLPQSLNSSDIFIITDYGSVGSPSDLHISAPNSPARFFPDTSYFCYPQSQQRLQLPSQRFQQNSNYLRPYGRGVIPTRLSVSSTESYSSEYTNGSCARSYENLIRDRRLSEIAGLKVRNFLLVYFRK